MYRPYLTCLLLAVSNGSSGTESPRQLQDGLWEITTRTEMAGIPESAPATSQSCYSRQDMESRHAVMPDAGQCGITNYVVQGDAANWLIACPGAGKISGSGTMVFDSSTAYHGSVRLQILMPGRPEQSITNHYQARRIGDCQQ